MRPDAEPRGILAAAPTPFNAGGGVDRAAVHRLLDHLQALGCDGALVLGTTGEGPSLSLRERRIVIDEAASWRADRDRPFHLLAGSASSAWTEARELCEHAFASGIDGVLVLPPYYYKQASDSGIESFYLRALDGLVGAHARAYLYHIPQLSGVALRFGLLSRLRDRLGEGLAGIKDSGGCWSDTERILTALPELQVFTGSDAHLLRALDAGARGGITALSNISGGIAARLLAAQHVGDREEAERLQDRLTEARGWIEGPRTVAAVKALLPRLFDLPAGAPRAPLEPLPEGDAGPLAERFVARGAAPSGPGAGEQHRR